MLFYCRQADERYAGEARENHEAERIAAGELLLDEPSQGLAPLIMQEVFKVVAAARREGISVLLVEQNVRAAVEIADRAYVLDDRRVVFCSLVAEFSKDEERVRALAGASAEEWTAPSHR